MRFSSFFCGRTWRLYELRWKDAAAFQEDPRLVEIAQIAVEKLMLKKFPDENFDTQNCE